MSEEHGPAVSVPVGGDEVVHHETVTSSSSASHHDDGEEEVYTGEKPTKSVPPEIFFIFLLLSELQ